ncbi:HSPB1-associated protein 1 [Asbolus verrucosus]|uniref:HSPB1-associated protein 1 n=1 Tax=Asbolus verrucosus TaxID=1661398 RepID=A0A482VQX6_ASBVE|nr:HSPB1-associated protein 1 [Asbolus verrucosus]
MTEMDPHELKYLLLNSKEPILFKNKLDWGLFKWNLEDWERLLGNEELNFRCGKNLFTKEPQWERGTTDAKATFKQFVSFTKTESQEWMYFDYKYLREWFNDIEELKKNINWSFFGFPELSSKDCTIWIGSKGAHTPCHVDTYGCNLVSQVYGRKQWILFPSEENLKPTRIPYEESSIYSKLNFFSPTIEDFEGVGSCRKIILDPGDVLFVPHRWWHYVENLDTAISINVWLPLPEDDEERLKEALVQLFVAQVINNVDEETKKVVLNPNSEEDIGRITFNASLSLINKCKNICRKSNKKMRLSEHANVVTEMLNLSQLSEKYSFARKIPELSKEEFDTFLQNQKNRFHNEEDAVRSCNFEEITDLVNAFTHPDVISLINSKLG